jgi:hypothetical protein
MPAATATSDDAVLSPLTAWAYRHQARRLRHHFRHDPIGLHLSLRALAAKADRQAMVEDDEHHQNVHVECGEPISPPRPGPIAERAFRSTRAAPQDERVASIESTAAALQTPADAVEKFTVLVQTMLGEGILRHSRRQALLRQASKLGIKRFEASLLIATVENRVRNEPREPGYEFRPRRSWSLLLGVTVLVVLEIAAVGLLAVMFL